jgi:hypothetical protein
VAQTPPLPPGLPQGAERSVVKDQEDRRIAAGFKLGAIVVFDTGMTGIGCVRGSDRGLAAYRDHAACLSGAAADE